MSPASDIWVGGLQGATPAENAADKLRIAVASRAGSRVNRGSLSLFVGRAIGGAADFAASHHRVFEVIESAHVDGFIAVAENERHIAVFLVNGKQFRNGHAESKIRNQKLIDHEFGFFDRFFERFVITDMANITFAPMHIFQDFYKIGHLLFREICHPKGNVAAGPT